MLTLEQIKAAHSKVKSGADFPAYIGKLKTLGVSRYTTYVADGHTAFSCADGAEIVSPARYPILTISGNCNATSFIADLKAHQDGKTDYAAFCNSCAQHGVKRWVVDAAAMTCTYYDVVGNEVLVEAIPDLSPTLSCSTGSRQAEEGGNE